MRTFFCDDDYAYYLELLAEFKAEAGVEIWAYCLMPNHVHLVAVPERENSLALLFREVHRRYSRYINFRAQWKGHLWQERFHSFAMDEEYLFHTVRYVELNPVAARLVREPALWRWSSAGAHLLGLDDVVVCVKPMLDRVADWSGYLAQKSDKGVKETIRTHSRSGRPAGSERFLDRIPNSGDSLLNYRVGRPSEGLPRRESPV